jgi:hypothetical protein
MSEKPKSYEENTREQYETLGRFVEAFEALVDETREACVRILSRKQLHRDLVRVAVAHPVITAKPIFEILRAIIADQISNSLLEQELLRDGVINEIESPDYRGDPLLFSAAEQNSYFAIMKFIADEYNDLVETRNALLHGTWSIGYLHQADPTSEEFYVHKWAVTKRGLWPVEELPKNAEELRLLAHRCDQLRSWIATVSYCAQGNEKLDAYFEQQGKQWSLKMGGNKTMLPRKLPEAFS